MRRVVRESVKIRKIVSGETRERVRREMRRKR
jgi:hypothetical protein